jgi:uncharacterized protein (DUF2141 family)
MRRMMLLGSALALAFAGAVAIAHHGPDTVTLDDATAKRTPVTFSHLRHTEVVPQCSTCHHTQKNLTSDAGVKVPTCASCHLDPAQANVPNIREMGLKTNPYHVLCINCHREQKQGPTTCNACHVPAKA